MGYQLIETEREIQITGACFIDELVTPKQITVDGDLIADRLRAPSILVTHGSLLCPRIEAERVHADILGIYTLDRLYDGPATFTWLRPMKTQSTSSSHTITNVVDMFSWPELVWRDQMPEFATATVARAITVPPSTRESVFAFVRGTVNSLYSAKALTPLGRQIADLVLAATPYDWRW